MDRDASRARADAIRWDCSAQLSASSSWSGWLDTPSWSLEERATLLCLQETDLEVHEAILVDELECSLRPSDKWDLSVELDEVRARVGRTIDDRATKSEWLS
jgi:hypothetical protein